MSDNQSRNHHKNKHTMKATIARTEQNIEAAEELITKTDDWRVRADLSAQIDRAEQAVEQQNDALKARGPHRRQDGDPDGNKPNKDKGRH